MLLLVTYIVYIHFPNELKKKKELNLTKTQFKLWPCKGILNVFLKED